MDQNSPTAARSSAKARNASAKARNAVTGRNGSSKKAAGDGHAGTPELNQPELLNALHAMQAGDFSVVARQPLSGVGLRRARDEGRGNDLREDGGRE